MKLPTELLKTAKKARTICEQFAFSHDSLEMDFHKVGDLCGMCAIASFFFQRILKEKDMVINCRYSWDETGCGHVYNEYQGIVIDLTATQFGSEHLIHMQPMADYTEWLGMPLGGKVRKRINWLDSQSPRKKVIEKLVKLYYIES
jgi:hypothetical protein